MQLVGKSTDGRCRWASEELEIKITDNEMKPLGSSLFLGRSTMDSILL